jgi:hypothetical protein
MPPQAARCPVQAKLGPPSPLEKGAGGVGLEMRVRVTELTQLHDGPQNDYN